MLCVMKLFKDCNGIFQSVYFLSKITLPNLLILDFDELIS